MTVSSTTTRNSYSGDGSTTVFAYGFKIFDDDDITVIVRTNATGAESVQTKTTDYTVSGVGGASGGNITFGTAPASGTTVVLLRETAQTQLTDYTPNDPFPAASHEDALDKLTLLSQDTQDEVNRSIKLSRTNTMTSTEFTVGATDRANKVFAFDSSGELAVTQEIGTFQGDWAASTAYAERDLVKDTSTNNIFIVNTAHTSSGSQPLTTNANSAKYDLIVDAATATTSSTSAASSATASANSATASANSATASASSASTASTQASNASTSATAAASSATAAASSATAAAAALDNFDDTYLGAKSSDPSTDNDGDALNAGDLYFNTTINALKVYDGSAWNTASPDLVGDTTPQLGGNLDTNGNDINFGDNDKAIFGAGSDLQIYHDSNNSLIQDAGSGDLILKSNGAATVVKTNAGNNLISARDAGNVGVFHNGSEKLTTTSTGVDVTGTVTMDGGSTSADFSFGDNDKALFGAGNDLQVYHDGTNSFILENGTGNLIVKGNAGIYLRGTNDENMGVFLQDGASTLYHNSAAKIATTSTGVDVTGTVTASSNFVTSGTFGALYKSSDSQILYIAGGNTNASGGNIRLYGGTHSTDASDILLRRGGTSVAKLDGGTGDISFFASDGTTQALFFDASTQRLGLGVTAPDTDLHVQKSAVTHSWSAYSGTTLTLENNAAAGNIMQFMSDNLATGEIWFGDDDSRNSGRIRYEHDIDQMELWTGGSARVNIDSGGNVGIGTSPTSIFQVGDGGADTRSTFNPNSAFAIGLKNGSNHGGFIGSGGTDVIQFSSSGGAERMRIDSSGRVGIGTTATTGAKLKIDGGATAGTIVQAGNAQGGVILGAESSTAYINTTSATPLAFEINNTERMRIDSSGNLLVGRTNVFASTATTGGGSVLNGDGLIEATKDGVIAMLNRNTTDGSIIELRQDGVAEGTISVSGTTVSYNGGHLSRWSRLADDSKDTSIVKGTVMTNLDTMVEWGDEDNEQLNKMAVSSVEGDANVAGVFVNWDEDDDWNDMNVAMTGDMVIRIAQGTTVARGNLLMSAGDGTAKPQGDDIVRSKTIAKVTSTNVSHTYDDGSYLVPCVLMAC